MHHVSESDDTYANSVPKEGELNDIGAGIGAGTGVNENRRTEYPQAHDIGFHVLFVCIWIRKSWPGT